MPARFSGRDYAGIMPGIRGVAQVRWKGVGCLVSLSASWWCSSAYGRDGSESSVLTCRGPEPADRSWRIIDLGGLNMPLLAIPFGSL